MAIFGLSAVHSGLVDSLSSKSHKPVLPVFFSLSNEILGQINHPHRSDCLTLRRSFSLISFGWQCLKEVEESIQSDENIVLHPDQLKKEWMPHYVDFLWERGCVGLQEFLFAYVKSLAPKQENAT